MNKLEQAKLFLNFYFAPWGAAKGEIWESITNDQPFSDEVAIRYASRILSGHASFNTQDIRLMKIVVPDS